MDLKDINLEGTITGEIAAFYIIKKCDQSDSLQNSKSTFKKEIGNRACMASVAITIFASAIADTLIGVGCGLANIITAGTNKELGRYSATRLQLSRKILPFPHLFLIEVISPSELKGQPTSSAPAIIKEEGDGFTTDGVKSRLKDYAEKKAQSKNLFERHVVSRLSYGLMAIACLVTRVFDAVISVIAVPANIVTLGRFESLLNCTVRALQFPGVISDIHECSVKILNPWGHATPALISPLQHSGQSQH